MYLAEAATRGPETMPTFRVYDYPAHLPEFAV